MAPQYPPGSHDPHTLSYHYFHFQLLSLESVEGHSIIIKLNQSLISQIHNFHQIRRIIDFNQRVYWDFESSFNPYTGFLYFSFFSSDFFRLRIFVLLNRTFFSAAIWKVRSSYFWIINCEYVF